MADAQWLATLARAGLLGASFIAKADLCSLRHIACQRQKLRRMLASEKSRLHKLLADAGGRLGVVVSDLHGQSARVMAKALIVCCASIYAMRRKKRATSTKRGLRGLDGVAQCVVLAAEVGLA